MNINTYWNKSSPEVVEKDLTQRHLFENVTLKNDTSITNPTFQITGVFDADSISGINYLHWNKMGRYYFIDDIRIVNGRMFEIDCSVDVLMSFKKNIHNSTQRVIRQQKKSNRNSLLLDDKYNFQTRYTWGHVDCVENFNSDWGYSKLQGNDDFDYNTLIITSGKGEE